MKLVLEGKRDEALAMFLPLFQKRGIETNISQIKQFLLNKFVTEANIHNLSKGGNYYLVGVARYYFEGKLTTNKRVNALYPNFKDKFNRDVCQRLDTLIDIFRNMYIDTVGTNFEQPEDFGTLTIEALFKKYNKVINKALGLDTKVVEEPQTVEIDQNTNVNQDYTYEILYSYEDAKKYNQYTTPGAWCITWGKQHYDGYIKRLGIHYIIFKRKGFENVPRRKGPNWTSKKPQDEYGNSLIALLQSNKNSEPIYITSRWNHGVQREGTSCEADHAYTKEEFFRVTGCNDEILQRAYQQWEANKPKEQKVNRQELYAKKIEILRAFKYAQMKLNGGVNPSEIFDGGTIIRDNKNNKGTYLVRLKISDDEFFCTLMDRKKLFYDDYICEASYMANKVYHKGEKYTLIKGANDKYMIFDMIHHVFVNLEGYNKFSHISHDMLWRDREPKYTALAVSGNQIALFNLEKMKPVRSNNGNCWFESITKIDSHRGSNADYRGHIDLPYCIGEGSDYRLYHMIYDSAASEFYLYDAIKDCFIENKSGEDGFFLSSWQRYSSYGLIEYEKQIGEHTLKRLQKATTDSEWAVVNGYNTFKAISIEASDVNPTIKIIGYKGYDENTTHYINAWTKELLQIEGKPIETYNPEITTQNGWLAISLSRNETSYAFWTCCLLYNPITQTFYHDNISGYKFHVYGGQPRVKVYDKENQLYEIPKPTEAAKNEQNLMNEIRNNFYNTLKKLLNS